MLLYDASGLDECVHTLFHKTFKKGSWEEADILLCGQKKLKNTPGKNFRFLVCNMTNTDHIQVPEHCRMISLEGEDLTWITSVTEHTIHLMLSLIKRRARDEEFGHTLAGKSLGIIGYGRVGQQLEKIAKAFRMAVFPVDRREFTPNHAEKFQLALRADFICLTATVAPNKKAILGASEIASIPNGSYVINTSRPILINNAAMFHNMHRLGGFASDFRLPLRLEHHDKVIVTDHVGGFTLEDLQKTSQICFEKLKGVINADNEKREASH